MTDGKDIIKVSPKDLEELRRLYKKTPDGQCFLFKDREILKEYAKYMIEYLEKRFKGEI